MRVQVRKHSAAVEFDDSDAFTFDEELAELARELPKWERAVANRPLHGLSPILDQEDDDDFDDFDPGAFVKRTYQ